MHLRLLALGPVIAALAAFHLQAQERRPVVAEDLYRLRFASGLAVSPDGNWVAYVVSRADSADNTYRADLWLAAVDGSEQRRLTWTESATESQPVFSADGRHLAFVSRREDDDRSQIYLLPLAGGGEARPVTDLETGAFNPVWSPNGQRMAFFSSIEPGSEVESEGDTASHTEDRPLTVREKLQRNAANDDPVVITRLNYLALSSIREERWNQIFVTDVFAENAEPVQITAGPFPHGGLSWSADSRLILYGATPPKGDYHADYELDSDIMLIAAEAHSMHDVLTGGDPSDPRILDKGMASRASIPRPDAYTDFAATYSPNGQRIAYMRRSLDRHMTARNTELVVMNADGTNEHCVSCELDRSVRSYEWDDDGRLYFTVGDEGVVPIYRTGPDGTNLEKIVDGARGVLSFDVAGGVIAWAEMNPTDPSEVHVAALNGEDERRITRLNDDFLSTVHVQPYEEMWYRAPDGVLVQGWVIRPPRFVAGAHPLAVEMHGGPHAMWGPGEQTMWHEYQMLAGAGYVVFLSNPRGSDGYGFEWKRAVHRNWGDLPMGDVLAGADSVLARHWADPERQTITGGSYAGYLTAWIVGHTDRFAAAVAQRGVYNMLSWYGGSFTWRLYESEFAALPWEDPMLAWEASPVAYVEHITTPLLIIHAEQDYTSTIANAEILFRALKVLGKETEFVRYPRASHELSRSGEPRQRIDRLLRIQEYFDRYVHPAAAAQQSR
jgi:dipeptidyl aminopeptidase/acylaminoacyl peptidase